MANLLPEQSPALLLTCLQKMFILNQSWIQDKAKPISVSAHMGTNHKNYLSGKMTIMDKPVIIATLLGICPAA